MYTHYLCVLGTLVYSCTRYMLYRYIPIYTHIYSYICHTYARSQYRYRYIWYTFINIYTLFIYWTY